MCKIYYESKAKVVDFKEESKNIYSVWLESKEIVKDSKPGQFINVQVSNTENSIPVLRRPFAISSIDGNNFQLIFDVVGRGTNIFKENLKIGKVFNVSGPLGNSFFDIDNDKKKLLIAGGLGIAPIKYLMEYFLEKDRDVALIWGNRDKSQFFELDKYLSSNIKLFITSDNGSVGFNGNVLDLLKSSIDKFGDFKDYDIYVVGPTPMMRAVSNYFLEKGVETQVSLEEPMACGIGVCQGCAVEKRGGNGFFLVCKEGPVFKSSTIIF
ncbi:MAG: hypothetical protein CR982_07400 [Candidatus Cloacimonadota bacterium]|nr:MAG: hypothetical protein CR982_07400 [Candidatus Cloacimonadota bacterium]PIE79438.1 MAG: hypothetical protein CSA15_03025 [Candidatus Delongbacteria bacterium]